MKEIKYEFYLTADLEDRIRVKFIKERAAILNFSIQYEAKILEKWYAVIRYDTSHNFAHIDRIYADGEVYKEPLYFPSYNLALVYANTDLKKNWKIYREDFERRINK